MPGVLSFRWPSREQRAQGRPGAGGTRNRRVQWVVEKRTRISQVLPGHPGLPRATALRLIRDLPGERPLLPPLPSPHRQARIDARVAAPGPHDFAVRERRPAGGNPPDATSRPSHPAPNVT
jgi:hypothetical protein